MNASKSPLAYLVKLSQRGGIFLWITILLSVISGIMTVMPFYALYRLIDLLQTRSGSPADLWHWGWLIFYAGIGYLITYLLSMLFSHITAFSILRDLRYRLARKLLEMPLGWFSKQMSGDTRKLFTEDVEKFELFIAHHIPDLVRAIVTPVTILVFLFTADWRMALVSLIPLVASPFFLVMVFRSYNKEMPKYYELLAGMNGTIIEYIRGMSVVRAFNQTAMSFGSYRASVNRYFEFWKEWTRRVLGTYSGFNTALESGALFILAIGGPLYLAGRLGLSAFLITLILGPAYISSLKLVYFMMSHMSMNFQGVTRLRAVLESKSLPEPGLPQLPSGEEATFENVVFAYDKQPAVKNLSFTVKPGQLTAFVGPSGAGKSTAALLAARFFDPDTGTVSLHGVAYPQVGTKELMKRIAICFQDSTLFKGTIEENIRMGNRTASFTEVENAAKAAQAHEFISSLSRGYATEVAGDRELSGGQIQRIAIARAILKDAPIVILDEATSYADPENERLIQEALNELLKKKTVIVVAHRLRTLRHADQILVFKNGGIVETGTFPELIAQQGVFARLYEDAQASLEWSVSSQKQQVVGGEQ
jgi:ATP-binding cassette subfamily B protein